MSMQGYWADLPSRAFKGLPDDLVAVLPIGAIEQHGPHLPLSVDADLVDAVVQRSLPLLAPDQSVLFLPTLSVTKSGEHDRHPGTLSLSADTLLAVLRDIGASVVRAGARRLVLLNGHGGNTALLEIAARDLRIAHDLIVAQCGWFSFSEGDKLMEPSEYARDLHAGFGETSAMLAARPERVEMAHAKDFRTAMEDWAPDFQFIGLTGQAARPGWIIDDLNAEGACGNAAAASADVGERLLSTAATNFAAFLKEFADFDHRSPA
jgi:creatinine amidohydrolase